MMPGIIISSIISEQSRLVNLPPELRQTVKTQSAVH